MQSILVNYMNILNLCTLYHVVPCYNEPSRSPQESISPVLLIQYTTFYNVAFKFFARISFLARICACVCS